MLNVWCVLGVWPAAQPELVIVQFPETFTMRNLNLARMSWQVILWDKIVENAEQAHLLERDMTVKYGLIDEVGSYCRLTKTPSRLLHEICNSMWRFCRYTKHLWRACFRTNLKAYSRSCGQLLSTLCEEHAEKQRTAAAPISALVSRF